MYSTFVYLKHGLAAQRLLETWTRCTLDQLAQRKCGFCWQKSTGRDRAWSRGQQCTRRCCAGPATGPPRSGDSGNAANARAAAAATTSARACFWPLGCVSDPPPPTLGGSGSGSGSSGDSSSAAVQAAAEPAACSIRRKQPLSAAAGRWWGRRTVKPAGRLWGVGGPGAHGSRSRTSLGSAVYALEQCQACCRPAAIRRQLRHCHSGSCDDERTRTLLGS